MTLTTRLLSALSGCLIFLCSYAQEETESKYYTTKRLQGAPPKINGLIDDPAWDQVEWGGGDFIQRSPDDGAAPSVQTYFKILYDDKNLYILFKNLDPEPEKIVSRMSRRDGFDGDWVEINIDSYFDKRTAFSFTSSVSGVKGDEYVSNNGDNWDSNWDPIWYLDTSTNDEGWIAELRIPLSQLRFANKPELTWGFNVTRRFFRNNERSNWQYIPQDAAGWVHLFGELRGLKGLKPQKQLEIQPYVVAKTERYEKEEGNPFAQGRGTGLSAGLDAKVGITSDITLDLTVNPDFGQVEADPSQVNLGAFQLFFREQRPFFIEGSNLLSMRIVDFNRNNLFYSRRIGRSPQGYPITDPGDVDDGVEEYVDVPSNSRIWGAAKLTGKNSKGFSWGVLESVTAREFGEVDSMGVRSEQSVEPLTNYLVGRVQQDIKDGETVVGGMFTATNRNIENDSLRWLANNAYSAGIDAIHYWKNRKYFISGNLVASKVSGDPWAITTIQESAERYYQRPDNRHTELDPTRRDITGTGGNAVFGKRTGNIIYDIGYTWRTPGLELNDIGFLSQTDMMTQWAWMQYRKLNPFSIFRSLRINVTEYQSWDFGGVNLERGLEMNSHLNFKNFWAFSTGVSLLASEVSNADLRGGPSIVYPGRYNQWLWMSTDQRKKLAVEVNPWWGKGFDGYRSNEGISVEVRYRPTNALNISVDSRMSKNTNQMQYVTTASYNNIDRYIVGKINQTTYNLSLRLTYMLTPNLSIQYWGQPFASTGRYSSFKRITSPQAENYEQRFVYLAPSYEEGVYSVDEDNDGVTDYTFDEPDFNFAQFRSNAVLRWEYIPGSTLFLVWTQARDPDASLDGQSLDHLGRELINKKPHNIFLIKYTYRFIL